MTNLRVSVLLTFEVLPNLTLTLPRQVSDAIERAVRSVDLKDKEGVSLINISEQAAANST